MSRNGTWLIAAATCPSIAAAAKAFPPPIDDPNVTTRFGSTVGHRRAKPMACVQSSSCRAGSNKSGVPSLSPNPRWSKTIAKQPCWAKRSANAPSRSRRVPDRPWAITMIGRMPVGSVSSGSYIQAAHPSPATSKLTSFLVTPSRRTSMAKCETRSRRGVNGVNLR